MTLEQLDTEFIKICNKKLNKIEQKLNDEIKKYNIFIKEKGEKFSNPKEIKSKQLIKLAKIKLKECLDKMSDETYYLKETIKMVEKALNIPHKIDTSDIMENKVEIAYLKANIALNELEHQWHEIWWLSINLKSRDLIISMLKELAKNKQP